MIFYIVLPRCLKEITNLLTIYTIIPLTTQILPIDLNNATTTLSEKDTTINQVQIFVSVYNRICVCVSSFVQF